MGLGLNGNRDHGFRELDHLHDNRAVLARKGLARADLLQSDGSSDITGLNVFQILALIGMHLQQPPDALTMTPRGIHDRGAGRQFPRVHPKIDELANMRISNHLEGQRRKGSVRIGTDFHRIMIFGFESRGRGNVERGRKVVNHRVEQRLHTLVLERRPTQHGNDLVLYGGFAERPTDQVFGNRGIFEIRLENLVVVGRQGLKKIIAGFGYTLSHLGRDLFNGKRCAVIRSSLPYVGFHLHQVDVPDKGVFTPNRQTDRQRRRIQALFDLQNHSIKIGSDPIHLVDKGDPGDPVFVRLSPDRFGLRLHARHRAEDHHPTIEHPQGALDLGGKIHVPGRVYNVDVVIQPMAFCGGTGNGNAPLLLLNHPVHGGGPFVDLPHFVVLAGVIQNALGRRGFSRIDVGHDTNVANRFNWLPSSHSTVNSPGGS